MIIKTLQPHFLLLKYNIDNLVEQRTCKLKTIHTVALKSQEFSKYTILIYDESQFELFLQTQSCMENLKEVMMLSPLKQLPFLNNTNINNAVELKEQNNEYYCQTFKFKQSAIFCVICSILKIIAKYVKQINQSKSFQINSSLICSRAKGLCRYQRRTGKNKIWKIKIKLMCPKTQNYYSVTVFFLSYERLNIQVNTVFQKAMSISSSSQPSITILAM